MRCAGACWALSGLLGHILISKVPYSERLRWMRSGESLSASADLMWQLVPPRTFATDRLVVTALLEPWDRVAGDAYDYSVNAGDAFFAVFDGAGHDLQAGHDTALAITAIRLARRQGVTDLAALAAHADDLLAAQPGPARFVTAVLATLDTGTGVLQYVLAGHPPPLLVRGGRSVKELPHPPRTPLGVRGTPSDRSQSGTNSSSPATGCCSTPTASSRPATRTASSSASTGWSTSPDGPNSRDCPHPRPCAGSPPPSSPTRADDSRTTRPCVLVDWSADARRRLFPTLP